MRILLLGKNGQIGWELQRSLAPLGDVLALGRGDLELANPASIQATVRQLRPNVIVNAAAYTAVDRAESEPELARTVNTEAPAELAAAAVLAGAALIHYSTDYVFDGNTNRPYVETDLPRPVNTYGQTKLEGERAIEMAAGAFLIFRTSWVYSLRRPSFVRQVLDWSRTGEAVRIAQDQVGSPTWCRLLAEATSLILARAGSDLMMYVGDRSGVYHLACAGEVNRLEWARAVLRLDSRPEEQRVRADEVQAATSLDFPSAASRPSYSALDSSRFRRVFDMGLPMWSDALALALAET